MSGNTFYTLTMAKLQEDQGNYEKAEEIYRHLMDQKPEDESLAVALERVQKKIKSTSVESLAPLFREWIELMMEYRNMKSLSRLRKGMG